MNKELIAKYNVSVPRYTSYPPANFFHEYSESEYIKAVEASNTTGTRNLSFYFHIPFCKRLCHYCGCNSYPMQKDAQVKEYIEALHKEIDLVAKHIDKQRRISQIHYGGGSPTALPADALQAFNEHLFSIFGTIEHPEIAIECHPGFLSEEDWRALIGAHFNRFSIGVQDFDEEVLKIVNRQPSALPFNAIVAMLREAGASINMDFLFGLPKQTPESFRHAIEQAAALRPDRITTFSYGHCPWIFKRQQILERAGLPASEAKAKMFTNAQEVLLNAGYEGIGLDHFVLATDELAEAVRNHQLHRNFQGYCTRRTTGQVYAFGVTGISQLDSAYAQNSKSFPEYIEQIGQGRLPVRKGFELTAEQQVARIVIETLMCNYHIDWSVLAEKLGMPKETIKKAVRYDERKLHDMAEDGIITCHGEEITVTAAGHPFVRNVAASFDPMLSADTDKKFSRPI